MIRYRLEQADTMTAAMTPPLGLGIAIGICIIMACINTNKTPVRK